MDLFNTQTAGNIAKCGCGGHDQLETVDEAAQRLMRRATLYYTLAAIFFLALIIGLFIRTVKSGAAAA